MASTSKMITYNWKTDFARQVLTQLEEQLDPSSQDYIINNLSELVVPAVEDLLRKADRLNLTEDNKFHKNFNTLNYIAQYLLRRNCGTSCYTQSPFGARVCERVGNISQQNTTKGNEEDQKVNLKNASVSLPEIEELFDKHDLTDNVDDELTTAIMDWILMEVDICRVEDGIAPGDFTIQPEYSLVQNISLRWQSMDHDTLQRFVLMLDSNLQRRAQINVENCAHSLFREMFEHFNIKGSGYLSLEKVNAILVDFFRKKDRDSSLANPEEWDLTAALNKPPRFALFVEPSIISDFSELGEFSWKEYISVSQFVNLCSSLFVQNYKNVLIKEFSQFFLESYIEREEDKLNRLLTVIKVNQQRKDDSVFDRKFNSLDPHCSGYVNAGDALCNANDYKDGQSALEIEEVFEGMLGSLFRCDLNRRQFKLIYAKIGELLPTGDDFVDYNTNVPHMALLDQIKQECRLKWLKQLSRVYDSPDSSLEGLYDQATFSVLKNSVMNHKTEDVNVTISLLTSSESGPRVLKIVHSSDPTKSLPTYLAEDDEDIRFRVLESNKIILLKNDETFHYKVWPYGEVSTEGDYILIPLVDSNDKVFGVLTVDTLLGGHQPNLTKSDALYFKGLGQIFSQVYNSFAKTEKIIDIAKSFIEWRCRTCNEISFGNFYLVKKDKEGIVFPKIFSANSAKCVMYDRQKFDSLSRNKNLMELKAMTVNGRRCSVVQLKDESGLCFALIVFFCKNIDTFNDQDDNCRQFICSVWKKCLKNILQQGILESARVDDLFRQTLVEQGHFEIGQIWATESDELASLKSILAVVLGICPQELEAQDSDEPNERTEEMEKQVDENYLWESFHNCEAIDPCILEQEDIKELLQADLGTIPYSSFLLRIWIEAQI